jgi:hypothetical protein
MKQEIIHVNVLVKDLKVTLVIQDKLEIQEYAAYKVIKAFPEKKDQEAILA